MLERLEVDGGMPVIGVVMEGQDIVEVDILVRLLQVEMETVGQQIMLAILMPPMAIGPFYHLPQAMHPSFIADLTPIVRVQPVVGIMFLAQQVLVTTKQVCVSR